MKKTQFVSLVTKGKLTVSVSAAIALFLAKFESIEVIITIERFIKKRSSRQNHYWHSAVVHTLHERWKSDGIEATHEDVHYFLLSQAMICQEPIWDKDGGALLSTYTKGSRDLLTDEFSELVEGSIKLIAEKWNIAILSPEEYYQTLGEKWSHEKE